MRRAGTLGILFIVVLLTTEFYYIDVGAGVLRPYHVASFLVILALGRQLGRILSAPVAVSLLVFAGVILIAGLASDDPRAALVSTFNLMANMSIAFATALLIATGNLTIAGLKQAVLTVTIVSVLLAFLQIAAYAMFKLDLAMSASQSTQIQIGFGPGFRTEANTYGKFLIVPFLLLLPDLLRRRSRVLTLAYGLILMGMVVGFTRTATIGLLAGLAFAGAWYISRRAFAPFASQIGRMIGIAALAVTLVLTGVVGSSEYAQYKMLNLFSGEEILDGGSSAFRIMAMENIYNSFLASAKTVLVGNGWGQVYMAYGDQLLQSGGSDLLTVLGYGGLLGGAAYCLFVLAALTSSLRSARGPLGRQDGTLAAGVCFALVGVTAASQFAGYLIAPEYWMLIGIAMALGAQSNWRVPVANSRMPLAWQAY